MRRSSAWHAEVNALAQAYGHGANGMGLLYAGGNVSARHLGLLYAGGRIVRPEVFGGAQPTDQQLAAMAREVSAKLKSHVAGPAAGHDTGMAAEFHILSCLHRLGLNANLTLGNKKAVDIVVALPDRRTATIDVKGLAGTTGFPVDNVGPPSPRHFLAFVSYRDLIGDLREAPEVYIVPSADFPSLLYQAPGGRKLVRLSSLRESWHLYEHAWHLLAAL